MNKKKISIAIVSVALLFVLASRFSRQEPITQEDTLKQPITVTVQSAKDSRKIQKTSTFPALLSSDQEVRITAKSAGTIILAPGNVGQRMSKGSILALIDDNGLDQNLHSLQVEQATLAVSQAKKLYDLAKYTNDKLRKSGSATKTEKNQAETSKDIAKLQYENAQLTLAGTIDNRTLRSPLSGSIVEKAVSVGDSVSFGQLIAIVSQNSVLKVSFFVDQALRGTLTKGQKISATTSDGTIVPLGIRNIADVADSATKRFQVEALPLKQDPKSLLSGTVVTVSIDTTLTPKDPVHFILPLGAITLGQNEQSLFIIEDNRVKKIPLTLISVSGENAEISAEISDDSLIVIDGNKLVSDGESVTSHIKETL